MSTSAAPLVAVAGMAGLALASACAHAEGQGMVLRGRGVGLVPTGTALALAVDDTRTADLDTPFARAPLFLTGARLLPTTVTVQYRFADLGLVKPYLGAGIALGSGPGIGLRLGSYELASDSQGVNGALQAGLDYQLSKHWYLNVDYRYLWLGDARGDTSASPGLKISPSVFGLGVGYRF